MIRIRLTSLVLLLVLAGSVFAGMPLHSNEQECNMGDMDCCKKAALDQRDSQDVTAARLCCALNCSQSGNKPSGVKVPQPSQLLSESYPSVSQPLLPPISLFRKVENSHSPPGDSHPAYIRNRSLLI